MIAETMLRRCPIHLQSFTVLFGNATSKLRHVSCRWMTLKVFSKDPAAAAVRQFSCWSECSFRTQRAFSMQFSPRVLVRLASTQSARGDAGISLRERGLKLRKTGRHTSLYYLSSLVIGFIGLSFLSVPLYKIFCTYTGIGGQIASLEEEDKRLRKIARPSDANRSLHVQFTAGRAKEVPFSFAPTQNEVVCKPGETVLAFFTATNDTDHAYTGISTYTVLPYEAAQYFNKIQCFCFEEQRLNAHEEIDMPVFFYIDPDFLEDPRLEKVDLVTLSYTFFLAKPGLKLPVPVFRPLESDPVYGSIRKNSPPKLPLGSSLPALGTTSGQAALKV